MQSEALMVAEFSFARRERAENQQQHQQQQPSKEGAPISVGGREIESKRVTSRASAPASVGV